MVLSISGKQRLAMPGFWVEEIFLIKWITGCRKSAATPMFIKFNIYRGNFGGRHKNHIGVEACLYKLSAMNVRDAAPTK
jgi:hypothetical protein